MNNNNHQQFDDLEDNLLQEEEKKKRKMKVSGKKIFELQNIIKRGNKNLGNEKKST